MELLVMTIVLAIGTSTTSVVYATTGMGGGDPGSGTDNPQPDRVGADDPEVERDGADDEGESNCWGKVTSDGVSENDGDGIGGRAFGQHASNPTGDPDNDTPREGVGNQDEDHPSDHADSVGGAFSNEDCIDEDDD